MSDRKMGIRITIVVEDQLLDRFCRETLMELGYHRREIRVQMAPSGQGSGKHWVNQQFVKEVKAIRSRSYQSLAVLVGTDVDELSLSDRIAQLDEALGDAKLPARAPQERIAYWLPKWHIETWLLALSGEEVNEDTNYKSKISRVDFKQIGIKYMDHYRRSNDLGLDSLLYSFDGTRKIEK